MYHLNIQATGMCIKFMEHRRCISVTQKYFVSRMPSAHAIERCMKLGFKKLSQVY